MGESGKIMPKKSDKIKDFRFVEEIQGFPRRKIYLCLLKIISHVLIFHQLCENDELVFSIKKSKLWFYPN